MPSSGKHTQPTIAVLALVMPAPMPDPVFIAPTPTAPTVQELLDSTAIGNGLHSWHVDGGVVDLATERLRPLLEAAYDPSMPAWPSLITYDKESGWHVA